MAISPETYERVALEDGDEQWELVCGRLRKKPGMTAEHSDTITNLSDALTAQLDRAAYRVHVNLSRLRVADDRFYVPDLVVLPQEYRLRALRERPRQLEVYSEPLPLVVEVWSPSTGAYDVNTKLPEYQRRGDLEIWYIHPYDRTLTAYRRQPDGTYSKTVYREGAVEPVALPGVRIALAALFE